MEDLVGWRGPDTQRKGIDVTTVEVEREDTHQNSSDRNREMDKLPANGRLVARADKHGGNGILSMNRLDLWRLLADLER